jgi:hypothetical protein
MHAWFATGPALSWTFPRAKWTYITAGFKKSGVKGVNMFDILQRWVLLYVLDHEGEILSRIAEMSEALLVVEVGGAEDLTFRLSERQEVLGLKTDCEYRPKDRMVLPYVIVNADAGANKTRIRSQGFVCGRKHFAVIE